MTIADQRAEFSPGEAAAGAGPASRSHAGGAGAGSALLPRTQVGSPPQHLLTTLMTSYWFTPAQHLPSAALVRLAEEFGVSAVGARAALSRLTRRGVLETSRSGRRTFYGLTPGARRVLARTAIRIMTFGFDEAPWDGQWTIAAFSLPEDQRDSRHILRAKLRWLGFAPLYDGMWVSARATPADALAQFQDLRVGTATVLRAAEVAVSPGELAAARCDGRAGDPAAPATIRSPAAAWDLDELGRLYADFVDRYEPLRQAVRGGDVSPSEGLLARTQLIDAYRGFVIRDPDLPSRLLPAEWPRPAARAVFTELYDGLGPLAESRVRRIVTEFDPDLAGLVRHRTVDHHTTRHHPTGAAGDSAGA